MNLTLKNPPINPDRRGIRREKTGKRASGSEKQRSIAEKMISKQKNAAIIGTVPINTYANFGIE
jgi:hypothetical protein